MLKGASEMSNLEKAKTTQMSVFSKKTATANLDRSDILIPKLLVMQGMSKQVADEKAQPGEIVNSVTGEVLAARGKDIRFIPIMQFKSWVKYRMEGASPRYIGQEMFNESNANLPWESEENGQKFRNDICLNFYVLLEKDLEDPGALPYLLSFRRTSYKNGRKLITHFVQCDMAGMEPYAKTLNLTGQKQQNDSGTYYIFDVSVAGNTSEKNASKIQDWVKILSSGVHKVDDSELEESSESGIKTKHHEVENNAQF